MQTPAQKTPKPWYQINNLSSNEAEILIYEQIGKDWWDGSGIGAKDFVESLSKLNVSTISVRINSLGGNVFDGNVIYNALKAHRATINVKIDGIAASIASVIAMAGDTVEIPENGMMMIHNPYTLAMGTASDMRAAAEMLDKVGVGIVASYRNKTNLDDAKITELMDAETWMTAEEAVALGFADTMLEPVNAQANFNKETLARFRNVPAHLVAGFSGKNNTNMREVKNMTDVKTTQAPEITIALIKDKYPEIANALKEEGRVSGLAEGRIVENKRIQDVRMQLVTGHEALVESLAFDGKTTGPEAAVQIIQAEKQLRAQAATNFQANAPEVVASVSTDADPAKEDDKAPIEDRAKASWDKSPEIRAEFGRYDTYLAFRRADADGRVKILGRDK